MNINELRERFRDTEGKLSAANEALSQARTEYASDGGSQKAWGRIEAAELSLKKLSTLSSTLRGQLDAAEKQHAMEERARRVAAFHTKCAGLTKAAFTKVAAKDIKNVLDAFETLRVAVERLESRVGEHNTLCVESIDEGNDLRRTLDSDAFEAKEIAKSWPSKVNIITDALAPHIEAPVATAVVLAAKGQWAKQPSFETQANSVTMPDRQSYGTR